MYFTSGQRDNSLPQILGGNGNATTLKNVNPLTLGYISSPQYTHSPRLLAFVNPAGQVWGCRDNEKLC